MRKRNRLPPTMTVQIPEETYQRMKAYLKRHQFKQKDFLRMVLERKLDAGGKTAK